MRRNITFTVAAALVAGAVMMAAPALAARKTITNSLGMTFV